MPGTAKEIQDSLDNSEAFTTDSPPPADDADRGDFVADDEGAPVPPVVEKPVGKEPDKEPVVEPDKEPVVEPGKEPVVEPDKEPDKEPVVEPGKETVVEPVEAKDPAALELVSADPPIEGELMPAEAKPETPGIMIPKGRFDEALARKDAEIKRLKEAQTVEPAAPVAADAVAEEAAMRTKFDTFQSKLLDEDTEGAFDAYKELMMDAKGKGLPFDAEGITNEVRQTVAYDATYATLKASNPQLDPVSADYDKDIETQVEEIRNGYMAQQWDPSSALTKAVELVMTPLRLQKQLDAAAGPPVVEPVVPVVPDAPITHTDIDKKTEVAGNQPAPLGGKPNVAENDTVNMDTITDDEWDALPESTKARLRGDTAEQAPPK